MKKQSGFTLIEIVMVLVLLGILSAIAVPKYFDLREQAEIQAAKAFVAECQSRVNAVFAQEILKGTACYGTGSANALAWKEVVGENGEGGINAEASGFKIALATGEAVPTAKTEKHVVKVSVTGKSSTTPLNDASQPYTITFPQCNN